MLSVLAFIYSITVLIQAQSCNVATTPSLNGLCPDGLVLISTGCCPSENVIGAASTTSGPCFDRVNPVTGQSDCQNMKNYCTNSIYRQLMMEQCPLTCGYCKGGTCFDRVNPATGRSDCPGMQAYCSNSAYAVLMKEQCPKTCGYCTL